MGEAKDDPLSSERVRAAITVLTEVGFRLKAPAAFKTLATLADAHLAAITPRSLSEWHEDIGPVLWWKFPVDEPPHAGTPSDSDWPGYHTHWTPIPVPATPPA